jgi:hypothetical protein
VVLYAGVVLLLIGFALVRQPVGVAMVLAGATLVVVALLLPAHESRASVPRTRLDQLMPVWQFGEHHATTVAASPERVFDAIRSVRADEILLFRTLTWLRRGGRRLPEGILNASDSVPIIDVATRTTFTRLADEAPREIVLGTIVVRPPGERVAVAPENFQRPLPPGFAVATMNFLVAPDGGGGSRVSTETRVFANSDGARRRFAMYWRVIYPGSALIRRMWLRAIKRRAVSREPTAEVR